MKKPAPRDRCAASFEWRRDQMTLTLSLAHPIAHQIELFQEARIRIGTAHDRSVVFVCYSVDRLAKGEAPYNIHALPKEEWPDLDRYESKRRLPLTVKLNDATTGVTCAERVGVLTFRVSDALLQELAGQAQSPLSTERYEKDLANALSWNRTHDLHLCAIMDPVGKPKKTSIGSAKKLTTRQTEDAALNKLYNVTIETDHFRDAINAIDELVDSREDLEILRAKLLALDGIESPAGEGDHRSLWDLAEDLAGALYDALATLGKTEDILDKIAACAPNLEEAEEGR